MIGTLATGAAAVYGQAEAEAGIIQVSNNPITSNNEYAPVYWDIDGNGSNDARIWNTSRYIGSFKKLSSISSNLFRVATDVYMNLHFGVLSEYCTLTLNFRSHVQLLRSGLVSGATLLIGNYPGGPNGFISDKAGYFGFKFNKGSDTHYGWAKMTLTDDPGFCGTTVIHEWAYEDTPGARIMIQDAGASAAVPEPSSAVTALGLLAAGAGGLRR